MGRPSTSADGLEASLEEAQLLGLVREAQSSDGLWVLQQIDDRLGGDVHVRLRVHAARDGEPDEFQRRPAVRAVGAAPGQRIETSGGKILFVLPGPPNEFNAILKEEILPWLQVRYAEIKPRYVRVVKTKGIGESDIVTILEKENFQPQEVELGFSDAEARVEASRCLRCFLDIQLDTDACVLCALCVDVCPVNIISIIPSEDINALPGGSALMLNEELCIRCALCIDRCPPRALSMGMWTGVGVPEGIPLTIGGSA